MVEERVVSSPGRQRALGASEVVALSRDHVPHAAARIVHVAPIARDDVHVQMRHGLTGCLADVNADVVAGGPVAHVEPLPDSVHQVEQGRALPPRGASPPACAPN
jgi:hypothetical protein